MISAKNWLKIEPFQSLEALEDFTDGLLELVSDVPAVRISEEKRAIQERQNLDDMINERGYAVYETQTALMYAPEVDIDLATSYLYPKRIADLPLFRGSIRGNPFATHINYYEPLNRFIPYQGSFREEDDPVVYNFFTRSELRGFKGLGVGREHTEDGTILVTPLLRESFLYSIPELQQGIMIPWLPSPIKPLPVRFLTQFKADPHTTRIGPPRIFEKLSPEKLETLPTLYELAEQYQKQDWQVRADSSWMKAVAYEARISSENATPVRQFFILRSEPNVLRPIPQGDLYPAVVARMEQYFHHQEAIMNECCQVMQAERDHEQHAADKSWKKVQVLSAKPLGTCPASPSFPHSGQLYDVRREGGHHYL